MIATDQAALLVDQALLRDAQDLEKEQAKGTGKESTSIELTAKEVKKEVKKEEKAAKLAIKVTNCCFSSLYPIIFRHIHGEAVSFQSFNHAYRSLTDFTLSNITSPNLTNQLFRRQRRRSRKKRRK